MDFFTEQEQARARSKHLIFLFASAVVGVVVCTTIGLAAISALIETLAWRASSVPRYNPPLFGEHWQFYALVGCAVAILISCASLYKWLTLRSGGERVARELGGRRVHVDTRDANERRLLNVVEEMSIASGLARPEVFILDNEESINAFAAGLLPSQAVIGISRGAVEQLSRDELQGVVAHEFSHILNGDMRINVRLMALLHGLLVVAIVGGSLLRIVFQSRRGRTRSQRSQSRDTLMLLLLGCLLWAVGSIGVLFGRLLKAAASREREYLADAAAVEFTRNPDGIGGALKKILTLKSSRNLGSPQAEEVTHMLFFSEGQKWLTESLSRYFDSHPPLSERIRRLIPSEALPNMIRSRFDSTRNAQPNLASPADGAVASLSQHAVRSIGTVSLSSAQALHADLPLALVQLLRAPHRAAAVAVLLVGGDVGKLSEQPNSEVDTWIDVDVLRSGLPLPPEASFELKFSVVQLCIPALRELHGPHRGMLLELLRRCIEADQKLTLFELGLFSMIRHALKGDASSTVATRALKDTSPAAELILSAIARLSHESDEACQGALDAALASDTTRGPDGIHSLSGLRASSTAAMTLPSLSAALEQLRSLDLSGKKEFLNLAGFIALRDGKVSAREREMFRIIGAIMECPVPLISRSNTQP